MGGGVDILAGAAGPAGEAEAGVRAEVTVAGGEVTATQVGTSPASQTAIDIRDVWEKYRLYHDKTNNLKEFLVRWRRATFEEFWALKGITLDVKKGEVLGIIGANGSGKSTLLKCIARTIEPSRGSIEVKGRVSALLELGAGFHPDLTGRENVFINGAMLGMKRREIKERFDSIVEFAELEQFIDMPVRSYSSGMYMRLGFSVAVHVEPDVLLIDEILAVGDREFQEKCRQRIDQCRAKNVTILFVSHNLKQVEDFCTRCVWLRNGEAVMVGNPAEVVGAYGSGI